MVAAKLKALYELIRGIAHSPSSSGTEEQYKSALDYVFGDKVETAQISSQPALTELYKLPYGNLTDGFEAVTKNGSMSTATISKVGAYDNIVVGAGDHTSYFRLTNRLFNANPLIASLRVRVPVLGAAPLVGFRLIAPSGTHVSSPNNEGYAYVNLSTGAFTVSFTGHVTTSYNGFSGTISANEIVELTVEFTYDDKTIFKAVRENGEISQVILTATGSTNVITSIHYLAIILAGGTFQLLQHTVSTSIQYRPKLALLGDSILSGAAILYQDTLIGKLKVKLGNNVANFSSPAVLLAGLNAIVRDVIRLKPEVVLLANSIDALLNQNADSANGGYAAWLAAFTKLVNTLEAAGSKVILVLPANSLWSQPIIDKFKALWIANFPGREYIEILPTEAKFDATTFHYTGFTNEIFKGKVIAKLDKLGLLGS